MGEKAYDRQVGNLVEQNGSDYMVLKRNDIKLQFSHSLDSSVYRLTIRFGTSAALPSDNI